VDGFGKKDILPGSIMQVGAGAERAFHRKALLFVHSNERLANQPGLLLECPKDRPGLVFILFQPAQLAQTIGCQDWAFLRLE
jgi:hypothetical protein